VRYLKYLCAFALVPSLAGLELMTGQNFTHFGYLKEFDAVLLGTLFQLMAFGLVFLSRVEWARWMGSILMTIAAILLVGWSMLCAMFSGWGDGASRGDATQLVSAYLLGGLCCFTVAMVGLRVCFVVRRKKNRTRNPDHFSRS